MALTAAQVAEQKKQVEELIASSDVGFAKALFYGKFKSDLLFPYPTLSADQAARAEAQAAKVRDYANRHIDHMKIDRDARIPDDVIAGLAALDVYRLTIPVEFGGLGFNQQMYLKTMEVLGGHDSSVAVFVNAHHSIGCRALVLFGTKEQQATWLPGLLDGSKLCAFALTEPEAGSDAGNVQTTATPDGDDYILNGVKQYITNGAIANVLTVMARTPVTGEHRLEAGATPNGATPTRAVFLDSDEWPGERYQREDTVLHIELRKWADVFLIAPLDANTLAKLALGLCDNCLTCVWRAWDTAKPVILAPAMNAFMWQHPFTKRHLRSIAADCGASHVPGHLDDAAMLAQINDRAKTLRIVAPVEKKLACGDTGIGGLAEVPDLVSAVREMLARFSPTPQD